MHVTSVRKFRGADEQKGTSRVERVTCCCHGLGTGKSG